LIGKRHDAIPSAQLAQYAFGYEIKEAACLPIELFRQATVVSIAKIFPNGVSHITFSYKRPLIR